MNTLLGYLLRPTKKGSIIVSSYKFYKADMEKNIDGLKAIDIKKAETLLGVSDSLKNLTIPILSKASTIDSIADLKEKYKSKISYSQDQDNPRGATTIYGRDYYIDLFTNADN